MAEIALSAVLSVGAGALASVIQKPKEQALIRDNRPTNLSERGSVIPRVFGTRRVGGSFGWAGDLQVTSGSGKGKGARGGAGTKHFKESAWQILSLGPGYEIDAIWVNGKQRWGVELGDNPIVNDTTSGFNTPSGSVVTIPGQGIIEIHWGQQNQGPVNFLGASTRLGIFSRWPLMCSVLWRPKNLGATRTWPQIEFRLTVRTCGSGLTLSNDWLDDSTSAGVNPAHLVMMLLTAPYPYGADINPSLVSATEFENLGITLENEHRPVNILVDDERSVGDIISDVLQDLNLMLTRSGKLLTVIPVRSGIPASSLLTDDVIASSVVKKTNQLRERVPNRVSYAFSDEKRSYRKNAFQQDDDRANEPGFIRTEEREIRTVTHPDLVRAIVDVRMLQDVISTRTTTFRGGRTLRGMDPGHVFQIPGSSVLYRVTDIQKSFETPLVEVSAIADFFSVSDSTGLADSGSQLPPISAAPGQDLTFKPVELPYPLAQGRVLVVVPRQRSKTAVDEASIHYSPDDTSFVQKGVQRIDGQAGAQLVDAVTDDEMLDIRIQPHGGSSVSLSDLLDRFGGALSDDLWLSGQYIASINGEIMFFRHLVAESATIIVMKDVLRDRLGHVREAHSVNDDVLMFKQSAELVTASDFAMDQDRNSFWKTNVAGLDVSSVSSRSLSLLGRAIVPYPVGNLTGFDVTMSVEDRTLPGNRNTYLTAGGDIDFNWDWANERSPDSAGMRPYDSAVTETTPGTDIAFFAEILSTTDVLKRANLILSGVTTFTYTRVQLLADFTTVPAAFKVRLRTRRPNPDGGFLLGVPHTITMTEV